MTWAARGMHDFLKHRVANHGRKKGTQNDHESEIVYSNMYKTHTKYA